MACSLTSKTKRRALIPILCLFSTLLSMAPCTFGQTYPPVPSTFQSTFDLLNTDIANFDASVRARWNGSPYPVTYAPQLLTANSDMFSQLLKPNYYANTVIPQLNALAALGSKGVTVHISFPILYQPFYSNPADFQSYVNFYQQLARDVRARGMKLIVEATTAPVFVGTNTQQFTAYYPTLTWAAYMAGRAQNVVNVLQLVQPDYVSVITEPDTEVTDTTQQNAGTVAGSTQLLQTILAAVQSAGGTSIPIGAGAGTWLTSSQKNPLSGFIQSFASLPIQFIDLHVYPINGNDLSVALTMADIAHAAGKQVSISETWLNKTSDSEVGVLGLTPTSARNVFSFWEPLDIAFLRSMVDYAQAEQLLFLSPFWTHYFSANLDYNTYGSLSPNALLSDSYNATANATRLGAFTATALGWESATMPAMPDTQAPSVPTSLVPVSVGVTSATLSWSQSSDNVGVAGYKVYRNGSFVTSTPTPGFYDNALTSGATYTYTVAAFDAFQNTSAPSSALKITTINTNPPTAPTNLHVTSSKSDAVSLTWSASTDIGAIAGYHILRGTSPAKLVVIANTGSATTYVDRSASPKTTYYYAVEGFIGTGLTGPASNTASVVTP